ncbi:MAG: hypothetical protein ACRCV0_04840 [Brevinema sp.]
MGKIYKNFAPTAQTQKRVTIHHETQSFKLPKAVTVALEEFDTILDQAEKQLLNENYIDALQNLVNLEISNFEHLKVHELLADLFLKINQLNLAKEQCQICAHLINKQYETPTELYELRSFDDLVQDAGNIDTVKNEYQHIMTKEITNENFHHGTKISLNFATLLISQKQYKEAEKILTAYKNSYLSFLSKHK